MRAWLDWLDRQSLRRPLACATVGFVTGLASPITMLLLAPLSLILRRRALVLLAAAAVAGWLRGAAGVVAPHLPLGQPRTFCGTVSRTFEAEPGRPWRSRQFFLDLDTPAVRVLARGTSLPAGAGEGDRIAVSGSLQPLPPERGSEGFDMRRWLSGQGALAILKVSGPPRVLPPSRNPLVRLRRLRRSWADALTVALHDDTASRFARSILLGDRNAVPRDSERAFRATGTTHVLVASGMNVMLLAGVVAWLLSRASAPRPALRTALLLLCAAYAIIAGAEAPILRAAIALSAWLVAEAVGRPPDSLNLLGLAALTLLALDPGSLGDPAFQLSFVAVASLILLTPALLGPRTLREEEPSLRAWILEGARHLLAANAAAWIGTAPLVLFHFGTLAPIALAANLVVAPLVWLVLTSALSVLAWQTLPLATPAPLALAAVLPARALDGFVALAARVPGGCLSLPPPSMWGVAVCYVCIAAGAAVSRRKGTAWFGAALACGGVALTG